MRYIGWILVLAVVVGGCRKTPEPEKTAVPQKAEATKTQQQGVTPMAGVGAGGAAPVSGSETVQGGGSAAGTVLKDKAKNVAGTKGYQEEEEGE